MIELTADSYISDYAENGTPFHAYYMTISDHGPYSRGSNDMSARHREAIEARYSTLSQTAQAYLACNMELDLAHECLMDKLEAADTYECSTGIFTPNEGITVDEAYVGQVHQLAAAKLLYSRLTVQWDYYKYLFPDGA